MACALLRFHAIAIAVAVLQPAVTERAAARIWAQWVQLGPNGTASVRVITDEACPAVTFDAMVSAMSVRAEPDAPVTNVPPGTFPVRSCEIAVPAGARVATIDGKPLPLPVSDASPRRILVFGDTGCRLLNAALQDCNNPKEWPFPQIAELAAAARPDLVIHVGDYHYRETACPVNRTGCAGSPSGYGWEPWNADFFEPAAPLLAAAPWIMVRGNHEDCERAGEGWFRFLDRLPMETACRDLTGHFVARLNDFGVIVVDGARAADPRGDAGVMVDTLRRQFADVVPDVPTEAWVASHRPMNSLVRIGRGADARDTVDNKVQELAFGADMPATVRMSVAGHVHFFQAIDFGGTRPAQLVVGTGGDTLSQVAPLNMVGADVNGRTALAGVTRVDFGYMIWERAETQWLGTLYDSGGQTVDRCRLDGRSLTCGQ